MNFSRIVLFLACLALISCDKKNENSALFPSDNAKAIPLGGNSYITESDLGRVTDQGFEQWTDSKTVFSTYFRTNTDGNLMLYLKYNTEKDGNETEVSCKGKSFHVILPKSKPGSDTVVYVGEIEASGVGYVQVDFKGVKKSGDVYAKPTFLLVDGDAAKDMNYVDDFSFYWGRRGPSVHLNYVMPENQTAEWFYNEVTVPVGEDQLGSYFMSNGFGEGYFGIQVNSETERRILFSVWSPFETDDPKEIPEEHKIKLVQKGDGVKTGEFGNEGSGGQSYLVYNWKAGTTYKFLTRIRPSSNGYSEYTAYFFAPEVGTWKLIAQFLRPGTTTYYTRPHSFLENFLTETGYKTRMAIYDNQWIYTKDKKWIELTSTKFTADNTARQNARMDYQGGVNESGFYLKNCGFFGENTPIGNMFERTPRGVSPIIKWEELK
ncbi:DUF3472 domain-containing protein [Massilibacteroides sp.]|uniref:DUF3472 domain-containing protein n=1 Tax=Massilibacteroides sp. TaxID=2034766 RepID=UPI002627AC8D|nr:DUF3472 domain-containing protein [Massilibacteroides sp.]MDD4516607.1 DUF3472 domain-containing protein [Massilibacteroides sp.]